MYDPQLSYSCTYSHLILHYLKPVLLDFTDNIHLSLTFTCMEKEEFTDIPEILCLSLSNPIIVGK